MATAADVPASTAEVRSASRNVVVTGGVIVAFAVTWALAARWAVQGLGLAMGLGIAVWGVAVVVLVPCAVGHALRQRFGGRERGVVDRRDAASTLQPAG